MAGACVKEEAKETSKMLRVRGALYLHIQAAICVELPQQRRIDPRMCQFATARNVEAYQTRYLYSQPHQARTGGYVQLPQRRQVARRYLQHGELRAAREVEALQPAGLGEPGEEAAERVVHVRPA